MFNDRYGLTKAVLEGRKTMTRRLAKKVLVEDENMEYRWNGEFVAPHYKVGEVVAVAQSYLAIHEEMMDGDYGDAIYDPFRWAIVDDKPGWSNKMFVKAGLMPYQIRITNIRVERLQDINDQECVREGITTMTEGRYEVGNGYGWDTTISALERDTIFTPREAFAALIDKVSGKGTWNSNPWVFVYEFELVK